MSNMLRKLTLGVAGALIFLAPFAEAAVNIAQDKKGLTELEQEVRHELVMLPWLGVFDNLEFQVDGFWSAFWGAIVVSVVSWLLSLVVKDRDD